MNQVLEQAASGLEQEAASGLEVLEQEAAKSGLEVLEQEAASGLEVLEEAAEAATEAAGLVISLDLPLSGQVSGVCRRAAAAAGAAVLREAKADRPVQLAWALWAQAKWEASFSMALEAIEEAEAAGAAAARTLL